MFSRVLVIEWGGLLHDRAGLKEGREAKVIKILRVNMTERTATYEEVPEKPE